MLKDRLHPKKVIWTGFRTRFRLPPSPPSNDNPKYSEMNFFRIICFLCDNRNRTAIFCKAKGHINAKGCAAPNEARASITAVSTKRKSDEHLLLLHRRLRRKSGHLTKKKEPRLEIALVLFVCSPFFGTATYRFLLCFLAK